MKILMLKTVRGSPDGIEVRTYEEGTEHEFAHTLRERDLAKVFVREGWAEQAGRVEQRDLGAAPENKDLGAAPENREAPRHQRRRKG